MWSKACGSLAYLIGQETITVPYAVKTELELKNFSSSGQIMKTAVIEAPGTPRKTDKNKKQADESLFFVCLLF